MQLKVAGKNIHELTSELGVQDRLTNLDIFVDVEASIHKSRSSNLL